MLKADLLDQVAARRVDFPLRGLQAGLGSIHPRNHRQAGPRRGGQANEKTVA